MLESYSACHTTSIALDLCEVRTIEMRTRDETDSGSDRFVTSDRKLPGNDGVDTVAV